MKSISMPLDLALLKQVGNTCTCFNLRKASRVVTQLFDRELQPSGLLVTQFTILAAIALAHPCTINELAQILVMDRTTLTRNLKPLEREALIQIQPGQDQRTRVISLTQAGQTALEAALPLWQQAQTDLIAELGQDHWQALLSQLKLTTELFQPSG